MTDGKDWYGLNDNKRYAASQLCYSRRTWDLYEALSGEHPMERPDFCFRDWYAVDNAIRGAVGGGLKEYLPLSWNELGLDVVGRPHVVQVGGGSDGHRFCKNEDFEPSPPSESTSWKDLAKWECFAALELCYFQELERYGLTQNTGPFPYLKAKQRYIVWDLLPSDVQLLARKSLLSRDQTAREQGQEGHEWDFMR